MRWWWKQLAAVCVSRMLCVESRVSEGNTPALRSESRRMERWNSWAPEPPRRWKKDTHRAVQAKQERGIGGKEACLAPGPWPFITLCSLHFLSQQHTCRRRSAALESQDSRC
jgi:hypothetical protein